MQASRAACLGYAACHSLQRTVVVEHYAPALSSRCQLLTLENDRGTEVRDATEAWRMQMPLPPPQTSRARA